MGKQNITINNLLYCFGKGSIRKLQPEKYDSVESAKNTAYKIYNNEMSKGTNFDTK